MPFLFLRDGNPLRDIRGPYVVYAIILINCAVFAATNYAPLLIFELGFLPTWAGLLSEPMTLASYQFVHGGWGHIFANLLMLYIFGDNIEDSMGHGKFLLFYLLTGAGSALLYGAVEGLAGAEPRTLIGASGSIAGVLAAYVMLHPRARVLVLVAFKFPVFAPSWMLIGIYVALDIVMAFSGGFGRPDAASVGWWAHIGGFVTGLALVPLFKRRKVPFFAPAVHYPETPFPELERDAGGRIRRLLPFLGKQEVADQAYAKDRAKRKPLAGWAAVLVVVLKVVSYISLLVYLSLEFDTLSRLAGIGI
ncbi:MAG: rhomboid family intramembrane serine protease [Pseudomonadota bacterium]